MAEERRINGRCKAFQHLYQKGAYVEFTIEVAPAFESLTLTRNRRIFTDKSAKQVIETILGEHRIAYDDGKYGPSPTPALHRPAGRKRFRPRQPADGG